MAALFYPGLNYQNVPVLTIILLGSKETPSVPRIFHRRVLFRRLYCRAYVLHIRHETAAEDAWPIRIFLFCMAVALEVDFFRVRADCRRVIVGSKSVPWPITGCTGQVVRPGGSPLRFFEPR